MKKMDKDGLILCDLQAEAFEISIDLCETSSDIFIRRFMNSDTAKNMDNGGILETNLQSKDIIEAVNEEYGKSNYGSIKYSRDEMYWIGYIYRYFSYIYSLTSTQVYRMVKPKELRDLFLPYHTLSCEQAIERILEAKHLLLDEKQELQRQYKIFKRIRMESKA